MKSRHRLLRTFHATCMVSDYDVTVEMLGRIAGLRVLEYGEAEGIGRRGGMTWIGDNSLEVAQPIVDGHAAQRFLDRFGPGMHSYAFQVVDLDATIRHLVEGGVTVGVRPADGFCFTDPRTTGGLLFEWSDFTVKEDPRMRSGDPGIPHGTSSRRTKPRFCGRRRVRAGRLGRSLCSSVWVARVLPSVR